MKKEVEKQKNCWNCRFYAAYYTKGFFQFDKEKQGQCQIYDKLTMNHDVCEKWSYNGFKKSMRKTLSLKTLETMAKNLSEITQILQEENEEDKIDTID